ncbi:hypothetical protein NECAME_17930, partial [Necator americanus]
MARSLRTEARDIRRRPPAILRAIGPLAVGKRDGDDAKMVVPGLGTFGIGDVKSTIAKFIPVFPFLQLPPLKTDDTQENVHTAVDPKLVDLYYPKPKSYVEEAEKLLKSNPPAPKTPFNEITDTKTEENVDADNPFDKIKSRPGYPGRARVHAVKTATEDEDLLPGHEFFTSNEATEEGFIKQKANEKLVDTGVREDAAGALQTVAA